MIRIDANKLREVARRRGLHSLEEVSKKAEEMGLKLALATVYSMAANGNWTRDKLQTLCVVLECDPRDFVYFERDTPKAAAPIQRSGVTESIPA